MSRLSRRQFLGTTAAAASVDAMPGNASAPTQDATSPADLIIKGSLTPGKLADIAILEKDPHDVDPDAIVDIKVLRTILGGRTTFAAYSRN